MSSKKQGRLPNEGELFAIPLKYGNYALALVLRRSKRRRQNALFCIEVFGPAITDIQSVPDMSQMRRAFVTRVGTSPFYQQLWPLLGPLGEFSRERWQMPLFVHTDDLIKPYYYIRQRDDDDPGLTVASWRVKGESELPSNHCEDCGMGHVACQDKCIELLLGNPDA